MSGPYGPCLAGKKRGTLAIKAQALLVTLINLHFYTAGLRDF
jgi:hypothetical protein